MGLTILSDSINEEIIDQVVDCKCDDCGRNLLKHTDINVFIGTPDSINNITILCPDCIDTKLEC